MKLLYIIENALSEIKNHKVIHIMIVICMFACTFLLTIICAMLEPAYMDISTLLGFKDKDVTFFQSNSSVDSMDLRKEIEQTYDSLNKIENIQIGNVSNTKITVKNITYSTLVYENLIFNNAKIPLNSGIQLYEYKGNYIPALVTEKNSLLNFYSIGDIITAKVSYPENGKTTEAEIKIEIVGILSYPYKYYIVPSSLSGLNCWDLLETQNSETVIIPDFEIKPELQFSKTKLLDIKRPFTYGKILVSEGSEEYRQTVNELRKVCKIITFDEVIIESIQSYGKDFYILILILISLFLLLTVGIGSANIYIGKRQIRSFAINFISGARWIHCLLIDTVRNIIVIIVPTLIGSVLSAIIFVLRDNDESIRYSFSVVAVILIYAVILFAISSFPYIIKLKNTEPITFIRTMNKD